MVAPIETRRQMLERKLAEAKAEVAAIEIVLEWLSQYPEIIDERRL